VRYAERGRGGESSNQSSGDEGEGDEARRHEGLRKRKDDEDDEGTHGRRKSGSSNKPRTGTISSSTSRPAKKKTRQDHHRTRRSGEKHRTSQASTTRDGKSRRSIPHKGSASKTTKTSRGRLPRPSTVGAVPLERQVAPVAVEAPFAAGKLAPNDVLLHVLLQQHKPRRKAELVHAYQTEYMRLVDVELTDRRKRRVGDVVAAILKRLSPRHKFVYGELLYYYLVEHVLLPHLTKYTGPEKEVTLLTQPVEAADGEMGKAVACWEAATYTLLPPPRERWIKQPGLTKIAVQQFLDQAPWCLLLVWLYNGALCLIWGEGAAVRGLG